MFWQSFRLAAAMAGAVVPWAAQAQSAKPIVAIYQMDDVAKSGQADVFSRMVETAIASTNKFRVIERERLGKLVGEQGRAAAGLVTTNRPGRVGGFEGADYLIYGSITSVSVSRKADIGSTMLSGLLSGRNSSSPSCHNAVVTLGIDIKITDADSGEVRYVTRIDETQKSAAACGADAQIDTSLLMRTAADRVAGGLVTTIYPVQVAVVQADGSMILNYGTGTILPGSRLAVFSKGESFRDPATGEVLGSNETLLGLVQVTDVNARFSKASRLAGFASPPAVGSIVRLATPNDLAAMGLGERKRR